MPLSLRERRTCDLVECGVTGNPGRDGKGESEFSKGDWCGLLVDVRDQLSGWAQPQLLQQVLETQVATASVEYGIDA
jgi:hypothetical protein